MPILGTFSSASARAFRGGAAPSGGDPYFSSVSLLVHADTSFADFSSNNFTPTASGGAVVSSAQAKFGAGSMALNGTAGCAVTYPNNAKLNVGSSAFTAEFWVYVTSGFDADLVNKSGGSSTNGWGVALFDGGGIANGIAQIGSGIIYNYSSISTGQWYHIALVRQSGGLSNLFIDGVATDPWTSIPSAPDTTIPLSFGDFGGASFILNGYIDEFRLTKGVARYTGNFTPPTSPFPNN